MLYAISSVMYYSVFGYIQYAFLSVKSENCPMVNVTEILDLAFARNVARDAGKA